METIETIETIAQLALGEDALRLRSAVQDWLGSSPRMAEIERPQTRDPEVLALSAGLLELFAERGGQVPPNWTREVKGLPAARYLVRATATMARLRARCEDESPMPLRRRNFFAPAGYLTFA